MVSTITNYSCPMIAAMITLPRVLTKPDNGNFKVILFSNFIAQ